MKIYPILLVIPVLTALSAATSQSELSRFAGAIPCSNFLNINLDFVQGFYFGKDQQILAANYFTPKPYLPPVDTTTYLKRLADALRSRGILPVVAITPPPGFAFIKQLDKELVKGTIFEKFSYESDRTLRAIKNSYLKTLEPFERAGFETVNLLEAMEQYKLKYPDKSLYFKHDSHWHPDGAQGAAIGVYKTLLNKFPNLVNSVKNGEFKVTVKEVIQRTTSGGWDGVIRIFCPNQTLFPEPFPVLELKNLSQQTLLDSTDSDIVLVGTSYSSNPPEFGFAPYLSESFGTDVLNASINGGGPLGSILRYFSNTEAVQPKILIWETPNVTIPSWDYNPLSQVMFRQLLPVFSKKNTLLDSQEIPLQKEISLNLDWRKISSSNFLKITFDKFATRKLDITLVQKNNTETFMLKKTNGAGKELSIYYFELNSPMVLNEIKIKTDGDIGNLKLEFFKYEK